MGAIQPPWYSRGYGYEGEEQDYPYGGIAPQPALPGPYGTPAPPAVPAQPVPQKPKPKQTMPSIDNSARASSNARPPMPGTQMPGGTPEWYGRATQQMPPKFTPPPGVGLQPPRPDAPERRRWLR